MLKKEQLQVLSEYLERNNAMASQMGAALRAAIDAVAIREVDLRKVWEPLVKVQNQALSSFRHYDQIQFKSEIPPEAIGTLHSATKALVDSVNKRFTPLSDEFIENFRRLPSYLKRDLIKLGELGWYLDPFMSFSELGMITQKFANDDLDGVEDYLFKHYEHNIDRIERMILTNFPKRKQIISKAFLSSPTR